MSAKCNDEERLLPAVHSGCINFVVNDLLGWPNFSDRRPAQPALRYGGAFGISILLFAFRAIVDVGSPRDAREGDLSRCWVTARRLSTCAQMELLQMGHVGQNVLLLFEPSRPCRVHPGIRADHPRFALRM